jgi:hypothetical protein
MEVMAGSRRVAVVEERAQAEKARERERRRTWLFGPDVDVFPNCWHAAKFVMEEE